VQSLARQGHTADDVRAILTDRRAVVAWGVDLLDLNDALIRPLDSALMCTVSRQMYVAVHGRVELTVGESLDWPNVRVRPWQSVGGIRFDLGVFGLETPESAAATGIYSVTGYDKLAGLQRIVGDTYWVPASTPSAKIFYTALMRQAIADSGVTGAASAIDSASDAVELVAPMVWALDVQDPATYLRIVNDAAATIAYRGVWADEEGRFTSVPFRPPSERASEWTFDLADQRTNIIAPDRTVMLDNWRKPTAWRMVRNGMTTKPVEGAGLYTVGAWSDPKAVRAVYAFDAASQDSLVAQGDQQVRTDTSRTRLIELQSGPLPCLGHFDIATVIDPQMGVSSKVQCRAWTQPLHAGMASHTWEMVDG